MLHYPPGIYFMTNGDDSAFGETATRPTPYVYRSDREAGNGGGLTKRELFAAMAMQGLCANPDTRKRRDPIEGIAGDAVAIADALIAELNKEKQ